MVKNIKVIVIVLATLTGLSLVGSAIVFYFFQQERLKAIVLTVELENVKVEFRKSETRLVEARNKINELNARLDADNLQIKELNTALEREKIEKNQFYSQIRNLQLEIQEYKKIKKELEAKQIQVQEELNKLKTLLQAAKDELKLGSRQEVELGKVIVEQKEIDLVQPEDITVLENTLEGTILVVNKDYDFVVINLGIKDGVAADDIFLVYHNGDYLGDIKVDRAQEIMSACAFVSEGLKDKIREGDRVIRK